MLASVFTLLLTASAVFAVPSSIKQGRTCGSNPTSEKIEAAEAHFASKKLEASSLVSGMRPFPFSNKTYKYLLP